MIKLLHTSDVQLDAPFGFLGTKGEQHRRQLRKTFEKIVGIAKDDGYQLLLIAGDLFNDNQPSRSTVSFVSQRLGDLPIPVCILPGNHDCYDKRSVYRKYDFPENVHVLTEQPDYVEFPEYELVVAGRPLLSRHDSRSPLEGVRRPDGFRWFVIIAHGNLQIGGVIESKARPIQPEEIRKSGADYVALGDWHQFADYSQGDVKAFYSGAPEPTSLSQRGAGYVAGITLAEPGVQIRRVPVGTTRTERLSVDAGGMGETEVLDLVRAKADPNLMLNVTLGGLKSLEQYIDLDQIREELAEDFYFLKIEDRSATALEDIDPAEFRESHVIGQYVRLMTEKIELADDDRERLVAEQALQLGVALLQGKDVL